DEPVALAPSGALPDLARHRGFDELVRGAARSGGAVRSASLDGEPTLTCAFTAGPAGDGLGVVVAGDFRSRGRDVETALRILVTLCRRLRSEALAPNPAPRVEDPGLAFPEGYVPAGSPSMRSLYAQLRPLAQGDLPVLL